MRNNDFQRFAQYALRGSNSKLSGTELQAKWETEDSQRIEETKNDDEFFKLFIRTEKYLLLWGTLLWAFADWIPIFTQVLIDGMYKGA